MIKTHVQVEPSTVRCLRRLAYHFGRACSSFFYSTDSLQASSSSCICDSDDTCLPVMYPCTRKLLSQQVEQHCCSVSTPRTADVSVLHRATDQSASSTGAPTSKLPKPQSRSTIYLFPPRSDPARYDKHTDARRPSPQLPLPTSTHLRPRPVLQRRQKHLCVYVPNRTEHVGLRGLRAKRWRSRLEGRRRDRL